jgi:hypothetical protein
MKDTVFAIRALASHYIQGNQTTKVRLPYTRNSSLSTDYLRC